MKTAQTDALARLLEDGDPETVQLVRQQLIQSGEDAIPELKHLATSGSTQVENLARNMLAELKNLSAEEDFELLCRFFPDQGDLETACWALARALLPGIDTLPYARKINSWGRRFLIRISGAVSNRERVLLLASFMNDLQFRGNSDDYYNERNSLLPAVIESRAGIPITLAALHIFVSHRAGMNVVGVNLPGHFIVRHGEVLFDPYHRGRILSEGDCARLLRCQGIEPREEHLQPASNRHILQRMLANLAYAFDLHGATRELEKVRSWLAALRREP